MYHKYIHSDMNLKEIYKNWELVAAFLSLVVT